MFVASFQHILVPGFGGNLAKVLEILTESDKWEGIDGTSILQC